MSNYLREILGAGKPDSNQSQLLGLVAADIPSADGEGANEGFWRQQLRDRLGNWAKMFGDVLFDIDVEGLGRLTGHGQLISMARPGVGMVRIKDHPVLPDNDYPISGKNLESLAALIPDEEWKRISEQGVNNKKPVARISDEDYARLVKDVADLIGGSEEPRDSLTGAEVQARKMSTVYKNLKDEERFLVPRQTTLDHWGTDSDIAKGAKKDYSLVYEKLKSQDASWSEKYPTFDSFWERVKEFSVGQTSQSPNDLSEIPQEMKDINKAYAENILNLNPDGKITFYRNAVNRKGSPEESALGYVTTNADFAYDYNSQAPNTDGNGRYEIDAKPDEIFGMLGYSQIEDEFGVVVGRGVTSQPDRVRRVGDLEQPKLAPWLEQYQSKVNRSTGSTPYRHYALAGQFDLLPVEPLGDNLYQFLEKHGKTAVDIKAKFDELYGEGSYDEYKASGNGITFSNIKNMFVDAGDGKVGLDITKIDGSDDGNLASSMYGDGDPDSFKNDKLDNTLKMLSVFQELSGQPFMVHRDHPKDDPRIPEEPTKTKVPATKDQLNDLAEYFNRATPEEQKKIQDALGRGDMDTEDAAALLRDLIFRPEPKEKSSSNFEPNSSKENIPYRTVEWVPNGEKPKNPNATIKSQTKDGAIYESNGTSDIINYAGRMFVIIDIDGVKVPFYLSTGSGGKKNVPAGKWYPAPGIGPDGWINKSTEGMLDYYGSDKLRKQAEWLNDNIGDIRNDESIPKVADSGEHVDFINQDMGTPISQNDGREALNKNTAEIVSRIEGTSPKPEYPTTDNKNLSTWDRIKLRQLKIKFINVLDDPEIAKAFESEDIDNLNNVLTEKGLYRKRFAIIRGVDKIANLENLYSKIDPNLNFESTTKPIAVHAALPGSKLGAVGYVNPQDVIDLDKENFNYDLDLVDAKKKEIEENGFTSPVTVTYDKDTRKYTFKDPETDNARLLAARSLKRYAPVVVEVDGELYHPLFEDISTPKEFESERKESKYPDITGIPDLPIPERTQEENDAIFIYRGWGYMELKSFMGDPYNTRKLSDEDRKKIEGYINTLDKLTSTEPIPEGTVLYRGIYLGKQGEDSATWREYFASLQPGDKLTSPVWFTSTTLDQTVAEEFSTVDGNKNKAPSAVVMKITAKDGATGAQFEYDDTVFALEKEVLLPMTPKLTVTNVYEDSDGILRIDLDYGTSNSNTESTEEINLDEENGPSIEEMVKDIQENPEKYPPLLPEESKTTPPEEEQKGADYEFAGENYHFTPEELQKAAFYVSGGAAGARDLTEEEGKEFNKRMRALSAYLNQKNGGAYKMSETESIASQGEANGSPIKVEELRHSAPAYRFDEIIKNGIKPKLTDKVGTDGYMKRRYGVFLANGYTSDEAGAGADIFRVNNLPMDELRVDAGYTRNGRNLYIERTIKPEELELLGHMPTIDINPLLLNKYDLHDGQSAKCTACHPELKATETDNKSIEESVLQPKTLTSSDESSEEFWGTDKTPQELKSEAVNGIAQKMLDLGIEIDRLDELNRGFVSMYDTGTNDPYVTEWANSEPYGQIMVIDRKDGIFVPLARAVNRNASQLSRDLAEYLKSMSSSGDYNFTMEDVRKMLDEIKSENTDYKLYQDISDYERATMAASTLVSDWASSSNGNNSRSLAIQEIAEIVFDTKNARVWNSPPKTKTQIEEIKQKFGDVLSAFLQAQYEQTQERFKKAGITEVVLYRGLDDPSLGKNLSDNNLTEVDVQSRPISSWSTDVEAAYWFATGGFGTDYEAGEVKFDPAADGTGSVLLRRVVPVEEILSSPFTGVGCYNEKEMVVIGGEMKADAVSAVKEDNLIQVMKDSEKSEWNPLTGLETAAEKKERIEPGFKNWYKKIQDIFTEADEDYDESRGNVLQSVFLEKSGFNDKPQVLSQEEFDAVEGESIYRGFTSKEFMDDYIKSDMQFAGEGYFGNGTYSTNRKNTTLLYTGSDDSNREDRIMEMKLMPDANAISFDDVTDLREWAKQKALEFFKGYDKSGATFEEYQDAEWRLFNDSDYTNIAIMLGIDAIRFKVPLTPDDEHFTIVLNRGKVVINGKS